MALRFEIHVFEQPDPPFEFPALVMIAPPGMKVIVAESVLAAVHSELEWGVELAPCTPPAPAPQESNQEPVC